MNSKTKFWALHLMAGALLLAACSGPVVPVTPDNLAGCWEGDALGLATAKVNITKGSETNVYSVDGSAKAGGNTYPIANIQVEYDLSTGELKPRNLPGSASVPVKLKVDGAEIKATATGTPFSINLKRCAGSIPATTASATPTPANK